MIRPAIPTDRLRVISMLKEAHAAGGLPFPFSAPHAAALFDAQLSRADRLCLVYAPASQPQGVLMASVQEHPFAAIRYAAEVVWWIDPSARGSSASRMLAAYEAWAASVGAQFVQMAALASFPRAGVIYERRGYHPAETHYLKPVAASAA